MIFWKSNKEKMILAWTTAQLDLNIEIETPFILKTKGDKEIKFDLLIKGFGSKKGTLIITTDDMTEFNTPEAHGYYCSALNPIGYSKYDRENFIDTLNDWGYYGDISNKPDWYTGESWTQE